MSYTDTTLTVQASYTNIHHKQVYDVIAAQLGAHAAWSLVDTVDAVVTTFTYRSFVWKCAAAQSGLTADFYVSFRLRMTTATGLWDTSNSYAQVYLFEGYNSTTHVASKMAMQTSATAQTLNADNTSPATWTLTADRPATAPSIPAWAGLLGQVLTSMRMLTLVAKDAVVVFSNAGSSNQMYAGAMDTLLSGTDDPFPLILAASVTSQGGMTSSTQCFASTRHPKLTGSQASVFAFGPNLGHVGTSGTGFSNGCYLAPSTQGTVNGTLGLSTDTAYSMFLGGPLVSKCCISTTGTGNGSTKGGLRGFFRHVGSCTQNLSLLGDTFTVDGNVWAGMGVSQGSLLETTAA